MKRHLSGSTNTSNCSNSNSQHSTVIVNNSGNGSANRGHGCPITNSRSCNIDKAAAAVAERPMTTQTVLKNMVLNPDTNLTIVRKNQASWLAGDFIELNHLGVFGKLQSEILIIHIIDF